MARTYFYKLTADSGAAPCVDGGDVLSLAICKPMIRGSAVVGDLIFGFAASSLHSDNRLIYVARVTRTVHNGGYYKSGEFAERGDRIYKFQSGHFVRRRGALHHDRPNDLVHDLGKKPKYPRANVLLSTDFRYFGKDGGDEYKSKFPAVRDAVKNLGIGHRVLHAPALHDELLAMKNWVWRRTRNKVAGRPSSAPSRRICYRGRSFGVA